MEPAVVWSRRKRVVRATAAAAITLVVVGIPTDVIANPWFGREIPVRWWEYPVLAATAALTAVWFGIQGAAPDDKQQRAPAAGVLLAVFAVGCPVCNKLVVAVLGISGALGFWAPIQPILALVSLALLTAAVIYRWRRRPCGTGDPCDPGDPCGTDATCEVTVSPARSTAPTRQ